MINKDNHLISILVQLKPVCWVKNCLILASRVCTSVLPARDRPSGCAATATAPLDFLEPVLDPGVQTVPASLGDFRRQAGQDQPGALMAFALLER